MTPPTRWTQPPAPAPGDGWARRAQVEPAPGVVFGGFWIWFVAYCVDAILVEIIVVLLVLAFVPSIAGVLVVSMIVTPIYFIGFWATTGQTIGMMPFRLRVVRNSDGGRLGFGRRRPSHGWFGYRVPTALRGPDLGRVRLAQARVARPHRRQRRHSENSLRAHAVS